jgi:hypothetical protein
MNSAYLSGPGKIGAMFILKADSSSLSLELSPLDYSLNTEKLMLEVFSKANIPIRSLRD